MLSPSLRGFLPSHLRVATVSVVFLVHPPLKIEPANSFNVPCVSFGTPGEMEPGDRRMQDLQARLAKLLGDADDCELIANLSTDIRKRAAFARLASQYKAMAEAIREEVERGSAVPHENLPR